MYSRTHELEARRRWDSVGKPLYSLGELENLVSRLAGMTRTSDVRIDKRGVLVFCADNGVVAQGVTQTDSSITALNAVSIATGGACVNAFARAARADVVAVDVGIEKDVDCPALLNRKVMYGTRDMYVRPAMTREQAEKAVAVGMALTRDMKEKGYHILCTGEMGIGNTTSSSAMAAVLLGKPVESVTGRGAGLSKEGLMRKIEVIRRAISLHVPDKDDPMDVLSKVGGLDIAAMTGAFLGGAEYGVPVVIDGFISGIAALTAALIRPESRDFMLASHMGREPACKILLQRLGLRPPIAADLALGEGTGAVALLPLIDLALSVYHGSSTFDSLNMDAYTPFDGK